jgi:CRP/FNR family transcriptional regulator, cyclic AMP receptor protein
MGVLAREQRNATVTATSPMMLVTLDRWDVKKLAKLAPTAVEHFQELVEKRREASAG